MKRFGTIISAAALLVAAVLLQGGCTTVRHHTFEGHNPDHVWTAMQVVAESPSYDDWHLVENEMAVQSGERRIEVYRRLRRAVYDPELVRPQRQDREYRLSFALSEIDPPTVTVRNRDCNIPSRVWTEADRYFADIADILGPAPTVPGDEPASSQPGEPADEPEGGDADVGESPDGASDAGGDAGGDSGDDDSAAPPPVDIDTP